jgi:hypothetical protein
MAARIARREREFGLLLAGVASDRDVLRTCPDANKTTMLEPITAELHSPNVAQRSE